MLLSCEFRKVLTGDTWDELLKVEEGKYRLGEIYPKDMYSNISIISYINTFNTRGNTWLKI